MLLKINNEMCYDNIREFAQEIGFDKFKKWVIKKYNFTNDDWNGFVVHKMDKNSNIGLEIFKDWFSEQEGNYFVEAIEDENIEYYDVVRFIRVLEFRK